jgi:hypothetical protein
MPLSCARCALIVYSAQGAEDICIAARADRAGTYLAWGVLALDQEELGWCCICCLGHCRYTESRCEGCSPGAWLC